MSTLPTTQTAQQGLVLYVEDEESDAFLVQRAFRQAGIRQSLRVVTDGTLALDYLFGRGEYADRAANPYPCLVLLDINLPQLSGLEVLKELRATAAGRTLPVVIFSSSEHEDDRARATMLGADEYIVKPSSAKGIVAVAEHLRDHWLVAKCSPSVEVPPS